jgi:hypothetical protein
VLAKIVVLMIGGQAHGAHFAAGRIGKPLRGIWHNPAVVPRQKAYQEK